MIKEVWCGMACPVLYQVQDLILYLSFCCHVSFDMGQCEQRKVLNPLLDSVLHTKMALITR